MKPHPRIRKTIKWTGAAVTMVLAAVWIASGWWYVSRNEWGHIHPWLASGRLTVFRTPFDWHMPESPLGVFTKRAEAFDLEWTFSWERAADRMWVVHLPLWPLVLAALALTLYAWHLDTLARRRARLNFCPKCNYDRTGLPKDAVCPECGAVAAALKPTESATHA